LNSLSCLSLDRLSLLACPSRGSSSNPAVAPRRTLPTLQRQTRRLVLMMFTRR
jgi:hypothetical protein